jgi:hypothetical protein
MKKIFFLSLVILFTTTLFAQITITDSDMPTANDTVRLSTTVNIQGGDPVLTGANFNWNFANLVPSAQNLDTFFTVGSTPIAYQFYFNNNILYPAHKASFAFRGIDIGIPQVPITEVFNYVKNSSSAYDNVGFGSKISGVPSSTRNLPVDREYEFPMNYNDNHISNSEFGITVPGFGYYGESMTRTDTVDGWGTVTTPYGTFNCLRVKSILEKIDTTYIDLISFGTTVNRPEEIEYKWLAAGMGVPVLKIVTTSGFVSQIEYQDSFRLNVGVAEMSMINHVTIYPNPVKSRLMIDYTAEINGKLTIKLKNILGKEVATIYQGNNETGNNKLAIDLTTYSIKTGIYFVEFLMDNQPYYVQKVIIVE